MIFAKFALAAVAMMAGVMATPTPAQDVVAVSPAPSAVIPSLNASLSLVARDGDLEKRQAGAGVHLVNCGTSAAYVYSMVVYCANDANCHFYPANNNRCVFSYVKTWETTGACTFPTGVTFSWNIQANAQSQPYFSQVGTGYNGGNWRIFRDNFPAMFTDPSSYTCWSIYYSIN